MRPLFLIPILGAVLALTGADCSTAGDNSATAFCTATIDTGYCITSLSDEPDPLTPDAKAQAVKECSDSVAKKCSASEISAFLPITQCVLKACNESDTLEAFAPKGKACGKPTISKECQAAFQ